MGGSMSIENATNVDLDISLDQLGPLYYESECSLPLLPCMAQ